MTQMELIPLDPAAKGKPGATWWAGSWECRNHFGYFQSREQGRGEWQFTIHSFGDLTAAIYRINAKGEMTLTSVPIDAQDRITVLGRKFGRKHWNH